MDPANESVQKRKTFRQGGGLAEFLLVPKPHTAERFVSPSIRDRHSPALEKSVSNSDALEFAVGQELDPAAIEQIDERGQAFAFIMGVRSNRHNQIAQIVGLFEGFSGRCFHNLMRWIFNRVRHLD